MQEISSEFLHKLEYISPSSRVWIYQSPRKFTKDELIVIHSALKDFLGRWNSHGAAMTADAGTPFDHFIVFAADEDKVQASGCSIDQSVAVVRQLSEQLGLDLFDRRTVALQGKGSITTVPLDGLGTAVSRGLISPGEEVFDNMVGTLAEMRSSWLKPLNRSWHQRFLNMSV